MKKISLLIILFPLAAVICFSQKTKTPVKSNALKRTAIQPVDEIPEVDWKILIDAVQVENWEKSRSLASGYLTKIKAENDKKQIARLRYILLYALAGKVDESSVAGKKPEEAKARAELEKVANGFLGKEFFMPSREVSLDCAGKLNYVCAAKEQKNVLRVTATGQAGTAIYSFEYVRLKENFSVRKNVGKGAVLGGVLKKIEFNPNKSNVWIMRLFFEDGSVSIVPDL